MDKQYKKINRSIKKLKEEQGTILKLLQKMLTDIQEIKMSIVNESETNSTRSFIPFRRRQRYYERQSPVETRSRSRNTTPCKRGSRQSGIPSRYGTISGSNRRKRKSSSRPKRIPLDSE